jgi:isopenicillin-N epimerase
LAEARAALGSYLHVPGEDLVYIPNATFGVNIVGRSLDLGPGDELLTSDHEYGACSHVWHYLSQKQGFRIVEQPVPLPLTSQEDIAETIWQGVTPNTKVIYLSQITSPTAVRFPVETICARARQAGILTVVDGAHAPGQIPLDLAAIGADFYTGNCHKWLCAPKGSAFLYARPEVQHLIEPLVVGWGWGPERQFSLGSDFLDYYQWLGTNDLSAYLSVPAAIAFQEAHNWTAVREDCHTLLSQALERINALTSRQSIYPDNSYTQQMAIARLPSIDDLPALKIRLIDEYQVEIPLIQWGDQQFIRVSVQGYNSQTDIDHLLAALKRLLS